MSSRQSNRYDGLLTVIICVLIAISASSVSCLLTIMARLPKAVVL